MGEYHRIETAEGGEQVVSGKEPAHWQVRDLIKEIREPMNTRKVVAGVNAGSIDVRKDRQGRLGIESWLVVVQGDGESFDADTRQLGVFWDKECAEVFADTVRKLMEGD